MSRARVEGAWAEGFGCRFVGLGLRCDWCGGAGTLVEGSVM